MPRVHHRKAAKDYPAYGIAKGDLYYYTKIKTGPRSSRVLRSKEPFKRSQLTSSEFLSQLYDIEDSLAALTDIGEARDLAESLRELGQEQQDKLDNMPEGLQGGDTGELLRTRAEGCETAADSIDEIVDEWETAHDTYQTELAEAEEARTALAEQGDAEESDLEDIDDPEEVDEDDFLSRIQEITVDT